MRPRSLPVALLLIGVLMFAVAACSNNSSGEEAARYEGEGFSLEIPSGWGIEERKHEAEGQGVLFLSPDPVMNSRALPNEVFVFIPNMAYPSVQNYVDANYDFSEITVRERREVQVPGATEAVRIETEGTTSPPEVTIRQVFHIGLRLGGSVVDIVCRGAAEDLRPQVCEDVLSSLRIAAL